MAGLMLPLRERLRGKRVGLIVCGANIDEKGYSKLLERGRTNILRLTKNS